MHISVGFDVAVQPQKAMPEATGWRTVTDTDPTLLLCPDNYCRRGDPAALSTTHINNKMEPIGQLIKEELMAQERSVAWFARKLCLDRSNVYRLFQKNSIDTSLLTRISTVLNKDFFAILSENVNGVQKSQQ